MTEYFQVLPEKDLKSMDTFLENWDYYEALKKIALDNKTIVGYKNHKYSVQSWEVADLGMSKFNGVHYFLEKPLENEQYLTNKLIVFFMPADKMNATDTKLRTFGNSHWDSLSGSVAKNTYILRIADSNLISGSYYQSTKNFPDFEEKIQQLIKKIAQEHDIITDNIVCYGNSRGATGALYHGLLGNYKVLAADPVIDRRAWVEVKDMQHMFDLVDYNFAPKINRLLENTALKPNKIKILTSDSAFITYPFIKQLNLSKVTVMNLQMSNPYMTDLFLSHAIVIGKTIPLQLSIINEMLYETDIIVEQNQYLINTDDWDAFLPWNSAYFDLHLTCEELIIQRNSNQIGEENVLLNFMLKSPMNVNDQYKINIQTDELQKQFVYFHDNIIFEEIKVDKNIKFSPKKQVQYLGFNALFWKSNEKLTIKSIKIIKEK